MEILQLLFYRTGPFTHTPAGHPSLLRLCGAGPALSSLIVAAGVWGSSPRAMEGRLGQARPCLRNWGQFPQGDVMGHSLAEVAGQ